MPDGSTDSLGTVNDKGQGLTRGLSAEHFIVTCFLFIVYLSDFVIQIPSWKRNELNILRREQ